MSQEARAWRSLLLVWDFNIERVIIYIINVGLIKKSAASTTYDQATILVFYEIEFLNNYRRKKQKD